MALLLLSLLFLVSCAETKYILQYEVVAGDAKIWPQAPEKPRYRYVGQLTGQFDLRQAAGDSNWFTDFLKALVGLNSQGSSDPLVLQRPQSGLVDDLGRVLVTDVSRHSILVFDQKNGTISEWGLATPQAGFITPIGIALGENGSFYIADADLGYVVQLDSNGIPINQFGKGLFKRPTGIARDPMRKRIYVVDTHGHDIKVFNDTGLLVDTIGRRGVNLGEFNSPTHVSYANNKLYVTDTFNTRVQILSAEGDVVGNFGKRGLLLGDLVRPKGVTTDSDGNIYVIESFHDFLLIYNDKGELLLPIGGTGSGVGEFYLPSGIWSDKDNRIYIADMFNGRIVILQYLGGDQTVLKSRFTNPG